LRWHLDEDCRLKVAKILQRIDLATTTDVGTLLLPGREWPRGDFQYPTGGPALGLEHQTGRKAPRG
jgi:hypothetical protein